MTDYTLPRPTATTSATSPDALKDNAVTFNKLLNEPENQTTYQGKELISWQGALDLFGFGVASFDFAAGGTLDSKNQLIRHSDELLYRYVGAGSFPLIVAPATNPVGNPDWEAFTATSLQVLSGLDQPSGLDQSYRRVTDIAEINSDAFSVGDKLIVSDAANSLFNVEPGAPEAGDIDAGVGKKAVLVGRGYGNKPKDISGITAIDGKTIVITGDSLSYNRYDYIGNAIADAYSCLHGIRSWPFLLRDYIHMNDMGFNYGDSLMGVPSNGMTTSGSVTSWEFGFNNRAVILSASASNSEYSFKMMDVNINTSKLCIHIGRIVGKPCQFDISLDSGAGSVFVKTVELPAATNYNGNDPIIVDVPYSPTLSNWHPKITINNWQPVGGGAFVSGGCAILAVGTKNTPVYMTGHGGWTAQQIADDYENRIGQYTPDVLICIAGANDRTFGNIASYEAGYRSIIEQTRATNPKCEIVLLGAMPATDLGYWPETAEKNGELMRDFIYVTEKLAQEYDCIHVDNYRAMSADFINFLFDNVHLNKNGNTRMFRFMCSEIMSGAIGNKEHLDGASTYGPATIIPAMVQQSHVTQAQIYPKAEIIISMTGGVWSYNPADDDKQGIIQSVSIPSDGRLLVQTNYIRARGVNAPFGLRPQIEQVSTGNKLIMARELGSDSSSFTFIFGNPATGALYTTAELEGNKFKISF